MIRRFKIPFTHEASINQDFPLFCKLSHIGIFLCVAFQTKKETFKGAKDFHMSLQGKPFSK